MSFLNSFLKDKKSGSSTRSLAIEPVSMDTLKTLIPIRNFSSEKLDAFANNQLSEVFPEKSVLFTIGQETDSALYLLEGSIVLVR